jgi:hypothetical protein
MGISKSLEKIKNNARNEKFIIVESFRYFVALGILGLFVLKQ